ncbi:MAG: hypothetical protein ACI39G_04930 [Pseudoramibacter sp.]
MDATSSDLDLLKKTGIDFFVQTSSVERLQKAMHTIESIQTRNKDQKTCASIKAGTTLVLAMFGKAANGQIPRDYSKKDWQDIAKSVTDFSVNMDDQTYSRSVFELYSDYIAVSAKLLARKGISSKNTQAIIKISSQLQEKTKRLQAGKIKETAYTEDCLWLCLEAMLKLMSASIFGQLGELSEAASNLVFEYGRLALYQRELALIDAYTAHDKQISEDLKKQFDAFMREIEEENRHINALIQQAFDPGFSQTLKHSAELAIAAGVDQDEVLKAEKDVDDFFMR